jgi:hypothetical protein
MNFDTPNLLADAPTENPFDQKLTLQERAQCIRDKMTALKEELKETVKTLFHTGAQELFKKHTGENGTAKLYSFTWTQYTPYWNDGDTCYFGSSHKEPDINDYADVSEWDITTGVEKGYVEAKDVEMIGDVLAFLKCFDGDDMYELFDDHVRVVVARDGVEIEDYTDHG